MLLFLPSRVQLQIRLGLFYCVKQKSWWENSPTVYLVFRGVIVFLPIVETDFAAVKRERNKVILCLCFDQNDSFYAEHASSILLKLWFLSAKRDGVKV